eukprot:320083-Chlamydomonas_euryale.AAC.3
MSFLGCVLLVWHRVDCVDAARWCVVQAGVGKPAAPVLVHSVGITSLGWERGCTCARAYT